MTKNTIMLKIDKKYIIDKDNNPVAVQVDIDTFRKIEQVLEDYGLAEIMEQNESHDELSIEEAKEFYRKLKE